MPHSTAILRDLDPVVNSYDIPVQPIVSIVALVKVSRFCITDLEVEPELDAGVTVPRFSLTGSACGDHLCLDVEQLCNTAVHCSTA